MYAVIRTGGKQYRVAAGDVIEVEHLPRTSDDATLTLTPVLVVTDDGKTVFGAKELAEYPVGAKVVGETKGDKIKVFKYRNKSGYARKTGHRQLYSMVEITSIGGGKPAAAKKPAAKSAPKKATAKAADAGPSSKSASKGTAAGTKATTKATTGAQAKPAESSAEAAVGSGDASAKPAPKPARAKKPAAESEAATAADGAAGNDEAGNVSSDGS